MGINYIVIIYKILNLLRWLSNKQKINKILAT